MLPRRSQALPGLAVVVTAVVNEHHHILHHQPRALELGDALQHTAASNKDVVDHHHSIAGIEVPLDQPARAVGLHFFSGVDQRLVQLEGQTCSSREGAVGNAGDAIKVQALKLGGIGVQYPMEEVGVRDDLA